MWWDDGILRIMWSDQLLVKVVGISIGWYDIHWVSVSGVAITPVSTDGALCHAFEHKQSSYSAYTSYLWIYLSVYSYPLYWWIPHFESIFLLWKHSNAGSTHCEDNSDSNQIFKKKIYIIYIALPQNNTLRDLHYFIREGYNNNRWARLLVNLHSVSYIQ